MLPDHIVVVRGVLIAICLIYLQYSVIPVNDDEAFIYSVENVPDELLTLFDIRRCLFPFGDVRGDATDRIRITICTKQWELYRNVGMQAFILGDNLLDLYGGAFL